MGKKKDEAKKATGELQTKENEAAGALALPEFMQGVDTGTSELESYIVPPRLKVVQATSDEALLDAFDPGTVIAQPQDIQIAGMIDRKAGKPFHFVPIYFFAEWIAWNPLKTKGTLPAIRERTFDADSPLAAKCKNPKLWLEGCNEAAPNEDGTKQKIRNCEHLNYICLLLNNPELEGIPVVMSFVRGEHKAGTRFAGLIKMRRAPLFGCQFQAAVGYRTNIAGQWHGYDVCNPDEGSGVAPLVQDKATFEAYTALHEQFKADHGKIRVDYDNETGGTGEAPPDSGEF
jgi:hypothetical protein